MFSNIDNLSKHCEEDTGDNEIFLPSIKEGFTERLRRTEKCEVTIAHHTCIIISINDKVVTQIELYRLY